MQVITDNFNHKHLTTYLDVLFDQLETSRFSIILKDWI